MYKRHYRNCLRHVKCSRERTITLDVDMEDYYRIKNGMGVTADATNGKRKMADGS